AQGLGSDLNDCLGHLLGGATLTDFLIGRYDVAPAFRAPPGVYGREFERRALEAAFECARAGAASLVLVSGAPGVGETALVHGLPRPWGGRRYFGAGGFAPVRAAPYAAIAKAIGGLVAAIAAEGNSQAAGLRARLVEAVGPSLGLLVEVIPELEQIVGHCT